MSVPVRKHLVTILDAPPEVQHWTDQFIAAARAGTGAWPHPHDGIPMTVVPLATFDAVMAQVGWARTPAGVPADPFPDPNDGSRWHDALHGLLGNFH